MANPAPLPGVSITADTSDDGISSATDEARARAVFGSAKVSDRTSSTRCGRRFACIAGFALILSILAFVLLISMGSTTTAPQTSPPNPPLPFSPPPPSLLPALPPQQPPSPRPPPWPPPLHPSPMVPPSRPPVPPFAPVAEGEAVVEVVAAIITLDMQIAGDVADFAADSPLSIKPPLHRLCVRG